MEVGVERSVHISVGSIGNYQLYRYQSLVPGFYMCGVCAHAHTYAHLISIKT